MFKEAFVATQLHYITIIHSTNVMKLMALSFFLFLMKKNS